jgi:hypothetical protein
VILAVPPVPVVAVAAPLTEAVVAVAATVTGAVVAVAASVTTAVVAVGRAGTGVGAVSSPQAARPTTLSATRAAEAANFFIPCIFLLSFG